MESLFDLRTDATNLSAAMKLAQATFPEDSSRRIVIITDGNENMGDAEGVARLLAADGVGIDVVPIELGDRPEVFVERVTLPADIRKGQPFEVRAVVSNVFEPTAENDGQVQGTIRLTRRAGQSVETLAEQKVTLSPGKNVFPLPIASISPTSTNTKRLRARRSGQRRDDAEQSRHRVHARSRQRPRAADRRLGEPRRVRLLVDRLRNLNIQVTRAGQQRPVQ